MSQSSSTADNHRPITTPTTAAGYNPFSHGTGTSTESSRPGTASAVRTETYGGYGGIHQGRAVTEVGLGSSSRRQSTESTNQTPSRTLGMHSILNPPIEHGSREGPSVKQSSHSAMSLTQSLLPAPIESPRSRKRTEARSPPRDHAQLPGARLGRRVLTPKSPGLRATSLGARRNPAFHSTIQPLQAQTGMSGRTYTAEPGHYQSSEIPPLPPLSIASAADSSNRGPADLGHVRSAHVPESPARGHESIVTPQTERSSASQTPYSKIEQPSPGYRYGSIHPSSQHHAPFRVLSAVGQGGYGHESQGHGPHEGYQQGPASYQMTLDTDQGPMNIPVELDLQQASKVADEKRKRNAGASARFRARRKEKEKEASQTISGLQAELRELIEERDHYLSERNYFRDLATRHGAQLLQRPQSPQHRRSVAAVALRGPPSAGSYDDDFSDDSYHERESAPTSQRRRTGEYQPIFASRQVHSPPPASYGSGFPSQPPLSLPPPPGQTTYGMPRTLPPGPPGLPGPAPPSVTRSQSYDPFRQGPFDRQWGSGR